MVRNTFSLQAERRFAYFGTNRSLPGGDHHAAFGIPLQGMFASLRTHGAGWGRRPQRMPPLRRGHGPLSFMLFQGVEGFFCGGHSAPSQAQAGTGQVTACLKTRTAALRFTLRLGHVINPGSPRNRRFLGVGVRSRRARFARLAAHRFYPGCIQAFSGGTQPGGGISRFSREICGAGCPRVLDACPVLFRRYQAKP